MVQFLDLPRQRSTGEKLMEGLGLASQSIGDLLGAYQKSKQEKEGDAQIASILEKESKTNPIFQPLHEIYKNPQIPHEQKQAAAKMLFDAQKASDPFKVGREQRLKQQGFSDRYNKAISALDRDIKDSFGKEKQGFQKKKHNLQKELSANMKRMRQGLDPIFKYLEDESLAGSEEEFGLGETNENIPIAKAGMPPFDPNNPQHQARGWELFEQLGDKEKVRDALSQEFSFE